MTLIAISLSANTFSQLKSALGEAYIGHKVTEKHPEYGNLDYIVFADKSTLMKDFNGPAECYMWLEKFDIYRQYTLAERA